MELQLKNKLAFITGASRGIGAATAMVLAEEGCDVVVGYKANRGGAEATAAAVRAAGRRTWLAGFNMADTADVARAVEAIRQDVQRIDVMVLCAGESTNTPFAELSPAEWQQIIAVNLNGPFYVLQSVRPILSDGAAVVTVASVAGQTGVPHHAHYAAAKAGLINLTKSAARALAPAVRVNCVAPGMTLTEMGRLTAQALPADYAQKNLLSGRYAEPEEIAKLIAFVASPVAGFMTGATLDINGGRLLR